ncbi:MAG: hypothetical protein QXT53_06540 [Ignisphaera sp.]
MGTKGGKPLSTLEKRQRKLAKKEEAKKPAKEERKIAVPSAETIDQNLISKTLDEINNSGHVTTFTLSQKLGIKYSLAKKILRELIKRNAVNLVVKNRRVILVSKK